MIRSMILAGRALMLSQSYRNEFLGAPRARERPLRSLLRATVAIDSRSLSPRLLDNRDVIVIAATLLSRLPGRRLKDSRLALCRVITEDFFDLSVLRLPPTQLCHLFFVEGNEVLRGLSYFSWRLVFSIISCYYFSTYSST